MRPQRPTHECCAASTVPLLCNLATCYCKRRQARAATRGHVDTSNYGENGDVSAAHRWRRLERFGDTRAAAAARHAPRGALAASARAARPRRATERVQTPWIPRSGARSTAKRRSASTYQVSSYLLLPLARLLPSRRWFLAAQNSRRAVVPAFPTRRAARSNRY